MNKDKVPTQFLIDGLYKESKAYYEMASGKKWNAGGNENFQPREPMQLSELCNEAAHRFEAMRGVLNKISPLYHSSQKHRGTFETCTDVICLHIKELI